MKTLILHAPEVRALLDTGTAEVVRAVKPQPPSWFPRRTCFEEDDHARVRFFDRHTFYPYMPNRYTSWLRSPFGQDGEERRIKETYFWQVRSINCPQEYIYRATARPKDQVGYVKNHGGWSSSYHMPKEASRLTTRAVSSRVEQRDGVWVWVGELEKAE